MKKIFVLLLLITVVLSLGATAIAENDVEQGLNDAIDEALDNLDFSDVNELLDGMMFGDVAEKVQSILNGEFDSAESFLQFVLNVFADQLKRILPTLATLFAICVLCGLVTVNKSGFISSGTSNLVYLVGLSIVLTTLVAVMFDLYRSVYVLFARLSVLIDATMPIVLTLMIANGATVSASVYQPAVAMLSGGIITMVRNVILPMCTVGLVFAIVSHLSNNVKVTKLSGFFTSCSSWLLGVIFMIFGSFLSVQGITSATIDGVSVRAIKFATKNYIPILGGYLSDGFDMIVASSTLIKNAFGAVVLLMLLSTVLSTIVSILAYNLGLQLVSAFAEPLTDGKFIGFFSAISKNLTFLTVLVVAVTFMFFILVMLTIYTANGFF